MAKIEVTINAENAQELKDLLAGLSFGAKEELNVSVETVTDEVAKNIAKAIEKNGEPADTEATKEEKKSAPKKTTIKKAPVKKDEASTDSTSKTEPSKTGTKEPTKDDEPEKSATVGQYPDATKADVQKAMKKALNDGKREELMTCFERFNVSKLSQLAETDYSAFLTDLEVLVGD